MTDTEKLAITVQALRDIIDPIACLTRHGVSEEDLKEIFTWRLVKESALLMTWARHALAEIGEQAKQEAPDV